MNSEAISLNGLSVNDLKELQIQIEKAMKSRQEEMKSETRARIIALLDESGFTLEDLFPGGNIESTPKRKVPVRYTDGKNTWTGRGKKPLWVRAFEESGGELPSIEVNAPA